jgi:hypothetical protein
MNNIPIPLYKLNGPSNECGFIPKKSTGRVFFFTYKNGFRCAMVSSGSVTHFE